MFGNRRKINQLDKKIKELCKVLDHIHNHNKELTETINNLLTITNKLENEYKDLYFNITDIIKDRFNEVSLNFDKLILSEANDLRQHWQEFEKHNKKLFKYKENKPQ